MSMTSEDTMKDTYVRAMLARLMYLRLCEYKNYTPRSGMYADAGSRDYADLAIDVLGYDDEAVDEIGKALERMEKNSE